MGKAKLEDLDENNPKDIWRIPGVLLEDTVQKLIALIALEAEVRKDFEELPEIKSASKILAKLETELKAGSETKPETLSDTAQFLTKSSTVEVFDTLVNVFIPNRIAAEKAVALMNSTAMQVSFLSMVSGMDPDDELFND